MPDKPITLQEIRELTAAGAEVEIERRDTRIERFDDLVSAIESMAANEAERIHADIARNQTNLEILATLQSLVKKQGQTPGAQPTDFGPLVAMLDDMRIEREVREQVAWEFDIQRTGPGLSPAAKIIAKPVKQTQH